MNSTFTKPGFSTIREMRKFLATFRIGNEFFILLVFRLPFDFLFSMYYAKLLNTSFNLIEEADTSSLSFNFIKFLGLTMLLFLYNGTVWSIYAAYTVKMHAGIRKTVFRKITGLSYQTLEQKPAGAWVTLGNKDVQMSDGFFNAPLNLPHASVALFNIVFSSIMLIHLNYRFFLLSIMFIVPHILISNILIAKPITKLNKQVVEETSTFTSMLEPVVTNSDIICVYDATDLMYNKINDYSLKIKSTNMQICKKHALNNSLLPLFGLTGYGILLLYGGSLVACDIVTFGSLTALLQYRSSLLKGGNMFINSSINMKGNLAGIIRINELMVSK